MMVMNVMAIRTEPSNGVVECRLGMKNCDFRPSSHFISEMIQERAIVTVERQLVCDLSNGAISTDLD